MKVVNDSVSRPLCSFKQTPNAQALKAKIEVLQAVTVLEEGQETNVVVRVKNVGSQNWPADDAEHPVRLSYHWLSKSGETVVFDGLRTLLPRTLAPGDEAVLSAVVRGPAKGPAKGDYLLEFDLVQEFVGWLKERGSETAKIHVKVVGMRPHDFGDYVDAWKRASLEEDYWSIVGIPSEDEFRKVGEIKLRFLTDLGLTPAGKVLDVGCGTGALTQSIIHYLSDEGLYYGTDVAEEAVTFCKSKFRRRNLVFVRNEMTRLPISEEDVRFDFVVFFSVFTHTFPDETEALLSEAKRLLNDRGMIVADAFCNPDVREFRGVRALVELNRNYLFELIDRCGLHAEIVHETSHEGDTRRLLMRLTAKGASS
jgi:SAM-dependent methyltransferase